MLSCAVSHPFVLKELSVCLLLWVLQLILEHLQASDGVQEAGPLMRGKVDEDGHSHSKAAFRMLDQFFVGTVKAAPGYVGTL